LRLSRTNSGTSACGTNFAATASGRIRPSSRRRRGTTTGSSDARPLPHHGRCRGDRRSSAAPGARDLAVGIAQGRPSRDPRLHRRNMQLQLGSRDRDDPKTLRLHLRPGHRRVRTPDGGESSHPGPVDGIPVPVEAGRLSDTEPPPPPTAGVLVARRRPTGPGVAQRLGTPDLADPPAPIEVSCA